MRIIPRGTWVIYQGSKHRYSGWSMRVTRSSEDGSRMDLVESGTGVRITNVRRTSVVIDEPARD